MARKTVVKLEMLQEEEKREKYGHNERDCVKFQEEMCTVWKFVHIV